MDIFHRIKPRTAVIILLVFALLGVALTLTKSTNHKKTAVTNLRSGSYYDKNSGQTVSNPTGKGSDVYGTPDGQPIYLGLSSLLNYGLSDSELNYTKAAFLHYSQKTNSSIKEVSIDINSIQSLPRDQDTSTDFVKFNVTFNRTSNRSCQLDYDDTGTIDLRIYNSSGTQLFDSGPITDATE